MKNYNMKFLTTILKDINVLAKSKEEAIIVARLMYPDTGNIEFIHEDAETNLNELEDIIINIEMAISEAKLAIGDIERALNGLLDYCGVDCLALS